MQQSRAAVHDSKPPKTQHWSVEERTGGGTRAETSNFISGGAFNESSSGTMMVQSRMYSSTDQFSLNGRLGGGQRSHFDDALSKNSRERSIYHYPLEEVRSPGGLGASTANHLVESGSIEMEELNE